MAMALGGHSRIFVRRVVNELGALAPAAGWEGGVALVRVPIERHQAAGSWRVSHHTLEAEILNAPCLVLRSFGCQDWVSSTIVFWIDPNIES